MPPLRMYVDSSVFGGYFDDEFAEATKPFFDFVKEGRIVDLVSVFVARAGPRTQRGPGARSRPSERRARRP